MSPSHIGPVPLTDRFAKDRWRGVVDGDLVEARAIDPLWQPTYVSFTGGTGQARVIARDEEGVVIAPLSDKTLASIGGPLPASAVAFIGARLASALATADWPGALTAEQVGLDASGHPVLAPLAAPDLALPGARAATPPEGFGSSEAALFGLGALLYALATGSTPAGDPPPAPSSRQPGVPVALDRAILGLLSTSPGERASAVRDLVSLAEPTDLRAYEQVGTRFAQATLDAGEVAYTTTASVEKRGSLDIRPPVAAVIVEADQLAALPPPALSALAGVSELPLTAVKEAVREGRPFVVQPLMHARGLSTATIQQQRALEMPLGAVSGPGFGRLAEILFFAAVTLVAGGGALVFGSWGIAAVAALAAILALVSVYGGIRSARDKAAAVAAHEAQERARRAAPTWVSDIAARRRELVDANLPEPVERDAREVLDALEAVTDEAEVRKGLAALAPLLATDQGSTKAVDRAERIAALHRNALRETR